jgi:hypothetical protein
MQEQGLLAELNRAANLCFYFFICVFGPDILVELYQCVFMFFILF